MRKLIPVFAIAVCGVALTMVNTSAAVEEAPPKKVVVCHGPGHVTGFMGSDYVIIFFANVTWPRSDQINLCAGRGGNLISISAPAAAGGHGALLLDRIDGYPDR